MLNMGAVFPLDLEERLITTLQVVTGAVDVSSFSFYQLLLCSFLVVLMTGGSWGNASVMNFLLNQNFKERLITTLQEVTGGVDVSSFSFYQLFLCSFLVVVLMSCLSRKKC